MVSSNASYLDSSQRDDALSGGARRIGLDEFPIGIEVEFGAFGGKSLRAGEIVLTGSLVKTIWLDAGDTVLMELAGLGNVSATFS